MKELVNPTHKPNRSGKDLSHRRVLSLKAGELLPVLCEEMVPNDYFEVDTASLLRTFPLRTAAFLRARVHYDFFFVPKTAVWRNFDRFYYQRNDRESSYMEDFAYEPNITLQDLAYCTDQAPSGSGVHLDSKQARAKVLELLGYGSVGYYTENDFKSTGQFGAIGQKSLTALPIAGYNRIFNFWYRNAWRDEPTLQDSYSYSLDNWSCSSYSSSLYGTEYPSSGTDFVKMYYHGWMSDLFMGSLPNQQFGSVSTVDVSLSGLTGNDYTLWSSPSISSITDGYHDVQIFKSGIGMSMQALQNGSPLSVVHQHDLNSVVSSFDVMQLRRALALQKWKEYNMRAGWKGRNQARAMFGVSTPEDRKHEIEFIKGYDFPVMVDEVISTSNTANVASPTTPGLGDIAGKGIAVGNGEKVKFNSGERHGYLYCIAYILPDVEYDAIGIEKYLVRSEPFDHYVPAFENLGMEPIYKYELNATGNTAVFNSVIGYAPRYHEYKTRIDKVYGKFKSGQNLSSWVSVRRDLQGIANTGSIPTRYFYVDPMVLDTIFLSQVDGTLDTDQFILNLNFQSKAVRPMSDLGLPLL